MSLNFFRTIRFRLTVWYSGLLAIFLIALSVSIYYGVAHNLNQRINDLMSDTVLVRVTASDETGARRELLIEVPHSSWQKEIRKRFGCELESGQGLPRCESLTAVKPVLTQPLRVGVDEEIASYTLHFLRRFLWSVGLAILIIAALGGYWLSSWALRPIEAIRSTAEKITASDLHQRINLQGPADELRHLADTFDTMIAKLEQSFKRQKEFCGDASHELQTPLAVMKTQVEVALQETHAKPEAYRDTLKTVKQAADHMSRTIEDLLTLAISDSAKTSVVKTKIVLKTFIEDVTKDLATLAATKGLTFTTDVPRSLTIAADPEKLHMVIQNVVDNAIKYSDRGEVRLTAKKVNNEVLLEVHDSGKGIPEKDLPYIFDRFYRADKGRGRKEGGTGLGLSIVKELVELHGGRLHVQSKEGKGSTFMIYLPIS